ncbi:thiol reductant ABC exporter subunit CydD [Anaerobacillus sp. CMMVII]|uniref:thiol reductant ABC exporter subunit CydD n=1 Tax=Anaerobacillus sp. CMMVII TaxID=2755588 RepID=UPI0021B781F4|nr:thiol reductant ABC exporter subunit CydD [Anaerobacillus sp. CMMVII]MCT8139454.1 thiol reductant ABC exporter subunit CydD [Anaerobacillus sp. CMMVII]
MAKIKGKIFAFFTSFAIISGVLAITQAYLIASIVDAVFLKGKGLTDVWPLFLFLLVVFSSRAAVSFINTSYGVKLASFVKINLRTKLVDKLSKSNTGELYEEKTGKHVSVLTDVVDQLDAYYTSFLPQLMQAGVIPLMIVIVVFTQNIYSGLIMLVTAPLIPVFMIIIGSMTEKKSQEQMDSMIKFSGHFLDVLQGLTTLKIFGRSKTQRSEIVRMSDQFRDTTMAVLKIAFLSALMLEILATLATAMIAVEVGLRLVYAHLTFHTAFFVLLLAPELYLPLKNLGASFHSGKNSIAAAETIWEVLDKKETNQIWGDKKLTSDGKLTIKLKNISFQYKEHNPILENIDVTIATGERVAFVGRSGSGKTTLLKVILGMLSPTTGQVVVNGTPLTELQEEQWLNQIAYVSQEPYLFSGTIAENILMGNQGASKVEVIRAAKEAGVDRFVNDLPKGYETCVGEAGLGLSGGEKQRVALARAFLKRASLVLLDEPTAGLDLETEQVLKKAIEKLSKNATVITVAHRFQTIAAADKIVLFSEGKVAGIGTHEQLKNENELYQRLFTQDKNL